MDDIFTVLKGRFENASHRRTIIELGAADGGDSLKIMESVVPVICEFEHIAFEPDTRNIASLRSSTLMRLPRFNLIEAAVGNVNGIVSLHQSDGASALMLPGSTHTFSSSVKKPKLHLEVHDWCKFATIQNVRMVRLDDFFSVFRISGLIDFIWCDIQGAEDLMIAGAQNTLFNTRLFYSECYEQEMYEGQIGRHEILTRLPGEWRIAAEWENDVLFENLKFT
jgi:FkbM family methyltransferase